MLCPPYPNLPSSLAKVLPPAPCLLLPTSCLLPPASCLAPLLQYGLLPVAGDCEAGHEDALVHGEGGEGGGPGGHEHPLPPLAHQGRVEVRVQEGEVGPRVTTINVRPGGDEGSGSRIRLGVVIIGMIMTMTMG